MNGYGRGEDKNNQGKVAILTRETVGMTFLLFSCILLLINITGPFLFGDVGTAITAFFVGLFGFFVYPLLVMLLYFSIVLTFGKRLFSANFAFRIFLVLLAVFLIVHTATAERFASESYGSYLSGCWGAAGEKIAQGTGGGVVLGLVAYPVRMLSAASAYIVFSILLILALWYLLLGTPLKGRIRPVSRVPRAPSREVRTEGERAYPGGVAFDELPRAERRTPPPPRSEPAPTKTSAPRYSMQPGYEYSRQVLYGDENIDYQSNLIYDRDSRFNTGERHSTLEPQQPYSAPQTVQRASGSVAESYQSDYSHRAEQERPAMPRRVTGENPPAGERGYAYPVRSVDDDFNYPQPSYRAPEATKPADRNYYSNDVEQTEQAEEIGYTAPAPYEEPPVYRRAEPTTPAYRAESTTPSYRSEPQNNAAPQEEMHDDTPPAPAREEREVQFRDLYTRPAATPSPAVSARTAPEAEEEPDARRFDRPSRGPLDFPSRATEEEPPRESRIFDAPMRKPSDMFDDDEFDEQDETPDEPVEPPMRRSGFGGRGARSERGERESTFVAPVPEDKPAPTPKKHRAAPYVRPTIDVLRQYDDVAVVSQEEIESNSAIIMDTLAGFRVDAEVVKVTCGSTVTRYDLDVPKNISVSTVLKRDEEIAMRLNARDGVNMYVNREHGVISVEVPNANSATVGLRSVLESPAYRNPKPGSLVFGIGKSVDGASVCGDIVAMKHLLVAGATGSGKSVCLNALLISLICKYSPEEMRLILVDPKKVEFTAFEGLPHLMINEIISDAQKAIMALNWAIKEMERRYALFKEMTQAGTLVREIDEYNANVSDPSDRLPKIVIVVDELADLMMVAKKDIEDRIQRLTQKARAAGIHVVLATQRPSVNVITGVIKSNLPTRIAFRVVAEVDSRTILDETGAQKLLGKGDMLYRMEGMFNCKRVQGAFLSSSEVQEIVSQIKSNNEAYFDESVQDFINKPATTVEGGEGGESSGADDENVPDVYIKALAVVVKIGSASISLIQRRCGVGYSHAGKIIEWMERLGYVSPFEGKSKPRDVLLSREDFENKYGNLDDF